MAAIVVSALALGLTTYSTASAAPGSGGWPALHPAPGVAGMVTPADVADTSSSGAVCRNQYFPVTLGANGSRAYREYGQLCTNNPGSMGSQPLQILLPGGTVSHKYFDWSNQPNRYFDVAGWNTHQQVQSLRGGALGAKFRKIVLNGYSMGGLTAQVEAERFRDVDAIAIHAVGHQLLTVNSTFHPESAREASYYRPGVFTKYSVPNTGHTAPARLRRRRLPDRAVARSDRYSRIAVTLLNSCLIAAHSPLGVGHVRRDHPR